MTLIELFDDCQIENVIAGLRVCPEKIIFVGFKETMEEKRTEALEAFFTMRNICIKLEYIVVERDDFAQICGVLHNIIDKNDDCCFDLTGGKELVLTAMGAVSSERNIPMIQFDVETGKMLRVRHAEDIPETENSTMTIAESMVLNGGSVVPDEEGFFEWDITEEFTKDVKAMWEICRNKCGLWNCCCFAFSILEENGILDEELKLSADVRCLERKKIKIQWDNDVITALANQGLIKEFTIENNHISFAYKNRQVQACLTKAGNILELYTYLTLRGIAEKEPGCYDDIDIGVMVDWDGIIHDADAEEKDTSNEIDVMLMRDLVPVFISCKNGEVKKEALYELETVANKLGGKYAKKILLSTFVCKNPNSRKFIEQRAEDMGIRLITGVNKMDEFGFITALKTNIQQEDNMKNLTITDVRVQSGDSAFLIDDGKTAILYDSGFAFTGYAVADKIKEVLGERKLDYIFLTHSHYDHALGSVYAKKYWPEAKIVAGEYAAKIFAKDSAKAVMRDLDKKFAKTCGVDEYEDLIDNLSVDIPVAEGDEITAGDLSFTVLNLPGHTKCSVGFYCPEHKLLLACESIGVYNGEDDVVPSYLVGYQMSMDSIEKVEQLDIEQILVPHYGLVDKEKAEFYLKKAKQSAKETAEEIVGMLKEGKAKEEIAEFFKDKFYHGYIQIVYPLDAMELNTGIMINLLEREFGLAE
ncbi:MAG: DUF1887 family protein [Clostridia bacterium]|nr:DUF1887 family protein [Clostridia bacterium]